MTSEVPFQSKLFCDLFLVQQKCALAENNSFLGFYLPSSDKGPRVKLSFLNLCLEEAGSKNTSTLCLKSCGLSYTVEHMVQTQLS